MHAERPIFLFIYRAKPDMRKSNEERFPNEHGCDAVAVNVSVRNYKPVVY